MSDDTWHDHVDAAWHLRGVTHGMIDMWCTYVNDSHGAKCQGEEIWER